MLRKAGRPRENAPVSFLCRAFFPFVLLITVLGVVKVQRAGSQFLTVRLSTSFVGMDKMEFEFNLLENSTF